MSMRVSKQIKKILTEEEISLTELANRLDISVNNLSNKLKRDNFKTEEIELIAGKLGYVADITFSKKTISIADSDLDIEYTDEELEVLPQEFIDIMKSDRFNETFKAVMVDEIECHMHKMNKEILKKAIFKTFDKNSLSKKD